MAACRLRQRRAVLATRDRRVELALCVVECNLEDTEEAALQCRLFETTTEEEGPQLMMTTPAYAVSAPVQAPRGLSRSLPPP